MILKTGIASSAFSSSVNEQQTNKKVSFGIDIKDAKKISTAVRGRPSGLIHVNGGGLPNEVIGDKYIKGLLKKIDPVKLWKANGDAAIYSARRKLAQRGGFAEFQIPGKPEERIFIAGENLKRFNNVKERINRVIQETILNPNRSESGAVSQHTFKEAAIQANESNAKIGKALDMAAKYTWNA